MAEGTSLGGSKRGGVRVLPYSEQPEQSFQPDPNARSDGLKQARSEATAGFHRLSAEVSVGGGVLALRRRLVAADMRMRAVVYQVIADGVGERASRRRWCGR